jgi:L-fucose isomerase-like protein
MHTVPEDEIEAAKRILLPPVWRRGLFLCAFMVAVPVSAVLSVLGWGNPWACVIAGAVGILLTRLDDLESFALGPLKAQLKRQVQEAEAATGRANATIKQVQRLAQALARPILLSHPLVSMRIGAPMPLAERLAIRNAIVAELKNLGVSDRVIADSEITFRRGAEMDLADDIYEAARNEIGLATTEQKRLEAIGSLVTQHRQELKLGRTIPASVFGEAAATQGIDAVSVRAAIEALATFQGGTSALTPQRKGRAR